MALPSRALTEEAPKTTTTKTATTTKTPFLPRQLVTKPLKPTAGDKVLANLSAQFSVLIKSVQAKPSAGALKDLGKLLASDLVQKFPKTKKPPNATQPYWDRFCSKRDAAAKLLGAPATAEDAKAAWEAPVKQQYAAEKAVEEQAAVQAQAAVEKPSILVDPIGPGTVLPAAFLPVDDGAPGTPWWKIGLGVAVVGVVGYIGYRVLTSEKE